MSKKKDKFDICFKYYEKAIEARNFHYKNYNTWVNYYSIFVGALFVGYYSIIDKKVTDYNIWISTLIALLGLITSICWHLTVKGHYEWMLSYIQIIHEYEEELAKISKEEKNNLFYVYKVFKQSPKSFYNENLSTQKMTGIFTFIVSIAWSIILFFEINKLFDSNFKCCFGCTQVFSFVIDVFIYIIFYKMILKKESNVNNFKGNITNNK